MAVKMIGSAFRKRPSAFDQLNSDCIRLIIEEINLMETPKCSTLCALSRTSRQLYQLTIPFIYRHIKIDLLDNRHLYLLQRLKNAGPQVQTPVRTIDVTAHEGWTAEGDQVIVATLTSLCAQLPQLQQIIWSGVIALPLSLLDVLSARKISIALPAYEGVEWYPRRPNAPGSSFDFLPHPATSRLTRFHWGPHNNEMFYEDFKKDLLAMLVRSTSSLTDLAILPATACSMHFPEMTSEFRKHAFPKLRSFRINERLKLFTNRELDLWGKQNAWHNLYELATPSTFIPIFLERVQNLKTLQIRNVRRFTTDDLEDYLSSLPVKLELPNLNFLEVFDCLTHDEYPQNHQTLLLDFLNSTPNLQKLNVVSRRRPDGDLRSVYEESDLVQMRRLCPKLSKLQLVLPVCWIQGRLFWPLLILRETACLESIQETTFWVDYPVDTLEDYTEFYNYKNCRRAFKYMVFCRKSKMMAKPGAYIVTFVADKPRAIDPSTWEVPYHSFLLDDRGHIHSYSNKTPSNVDFWKGKPSVDTLRYNALDDNQLVKAIAEKTKIIRSPYNTHPIKYALTIRERHRMVSERKRRERNREVSKNFGEYATLIDIWSRNEAA